MLKLRAELDLRLKVEVHELEERKNQHINGLMENHERSFNEMKAYYNDITRENLELIKSNKNRLEEIRKQINANEKINSSLKKAITDLSPKLQTA